MQPLVADYAALAYEMASKTGLDGDIALFRVAGELLAQLEQWVPVAMPDMPLELENVHSGEQLELLLEKQPALAAIFGRYRASVTEYEAKNAGRLLTLASTVRTLAALRARQPDLAALPASARMLERMCAHITLRWRVKVPSDALDLRRWSSSITRRYDLLPRAWREL
jgi:hypothetical protein